MKIVSSKYTNGICQTLAMGVHERALHCIMGGPANEEGKWNFYLSKLKLYLSENTTGICQTLAMGVHERALHCIMGGPANEERKWSANNTRQTPRCIALLPSLHYSSARSCIFVFFLYFPRVKLTLAIRGRLLAALHCLLSTIVQELVHCATPFQLL